MKRVRLDLLLVERGLAASRERARALVLAGQVRVAGRRVSKAGEPVDPDAPLELVTADHPYVGRGGIKLAHALDVFGIGVEGRDALDIGASTGGFTDALLQAGARSVVALDVGHGQLAWSLRTDPRVVVLERLNVRHLAPDQLPGTHHTFDIVAIDVSFISLRLVLPAVPAVLRPGADVVALVKPQFEAGRGEVGRGGIVRDPEVHARVVNEVAAAAAALGLALVAQAPSPIEGADGNREFLSHFRKRETTDTGIENPGDPARSRLTDARSYPAGTHPPCRHPRETAPHRVGPPARAARRLADRARPGGRAGDRHRRARRLPHGGARRVG